MSTGNQYIDAQLTNISKRSARIFTDLNLNFLAHPIKKDIQKLHDVEAIKRSVRNLVNLNVFEKPFHPEIAAGVRELLFEPVSPFVIDVLTFRIQNVLITYEPRIDLEAVLITDNADNNEYIISVEFYLKNIKSELITFDTILERTR